MLAFFRTDVNTTVKRCKILFLENKYFQYKGQETFGTWMLK